MAQRELKINVSSNVDKSLTDLLNKLDKYAKGTTINVKAVTNSKDVTALFNSINKLKGKQVKIGVNADGNKVLKVQKDLLSLKNKTVHVKVDANTREVTTLENKVSKLNGKTVKVTATASTSGLDKVQGTMEQIDKSVDKANAKPVKIKGDTSGLNDVVNTLDRISAKVLELSARTAFSIGRGLAKDASELYDAQAEFVNNMRSLDNPMSDKAINNSLKMLSKYGAQTKYSVAELTNLAGALKGAGFDQDFGGFDNLTKNLANVSALGAKPSKALKSLSTQVKQMSLEGKVMAKDWNPIRDAIGGTATQKILKKFKEEYDNFGEENFASALKEGKVLGKDFIKVLNEVGQDKALVNAATNTKSLSAAWENLRESLTVGLVGTPFEKGALTPAIDGLVQLMNTVAQSGEVIGDFVGKGVNKAMDLFKDMFGEFDFKQGLKDFVTYLSPLGKGIELVARAFAKINNHGKNTGKILGSIITLSAGWLVVSKLSKSFNALKNSITAISGLKMPSFFGGKGNTPKSGSKGSTNPLGGLYGQLGDSAKMLAMAGSFKLIVSAMKDLSNTNMNFGDITAKLTGMTTAIVAFGGTATLIGKALNKYELQKDLMVGATAMAGSVTAMLLMAKAFEQLNKVKLNPSKLATTIGTMTLATTLFGGLATALGALLTLSGGIGALALGAGLLGLMATAGSMVVVGKAMESVAKSVVKVNKVKLPSPTAFGKQMVKFTALVTEMSMASAISGQMSTLALIPSLFGTLGNMAQSLQVDSIIKLANKLNKLQSVAKTIPDKSSFKSTIDKIKNLSELMSSIGSVNVSNINNPLDLFASLGRSLGNVASGLETSTLTKTITKLSTFISTVTKLEVPTDISGLKTKIQSLASIQKTLNSAFADFSLNTGSGTIDYSSVFLNLNNAIASFLDGWETSNNIKNFERLAKFVTDLSSLELPEDMSVVQTKFQQIADIKNKLNSAFSLLSVNVGGLNINYSDVMLNLNNALASWLDNQTTSNLIKNFEKLTKFVDDFGTINIPDNTQTIDKNIENLNKALASLKKLGNENFLDSINIFKKNFEAMGALFDNSTTTNKLDQFKKLVDFVNNISKLDLDAKGLDSIEEKIDNMTKVLKKVADFKLPDMKAFDDNSIKNLGKIKDVVDKVKEITDALNNIPDGLDLEAKIESVKNALTKIGELPAMDVFTNKDLFTKDVTNSASNISKFVSSLSKIANSLNEINQIPDLSAVGDRIEQIKANVQAITQGGEDGTSLMSLFDAFKGKSDYGKLAEEASSMISAIKSIADSLVQIPEMNAEGSSIQERIDKIKEALNSLADTAKGGFLDKIKDLAKVSESVATVLQAVNDLKAIADSLNSFPIIVEDLAERFSKMNTAITLLGVGSASVLGNLQKIEVDTGKIEIILDTVNKVRAVADVLNTFPVVNTETLTASIEAIKNALAQINGINADDTAVGNLTAVLNKLNEVRNALNMFSGEASSAGTTAGTGFATGFVASVGNRLVEKVREQKTAIENLGWEATGASISQKIVNGFDISGVLNKINQIQSAIDSIKGKTVDITINETTVKSTRKGPRRQHGGIIPEYHSTGGVVGRRSFTSLGTDTVPAMLTAGEYVLKRSVSSLLGREFLDNLNQMNLTSALKALANKAGQHVVNNTTNNITQNVDNKASFLNGLTEIKGVIRP